MSETRLRNSPSGLDSLQVREAHFRKLRSRHFGSLRFTAVWISLGTIVIWLFIALVTGLAH